MKQILFLIAILFATVSYSQEAEFRTIPISKIGEGGYKANGQVKFITQNAKSETICQFKNDTLHVISKQVKFIVVDGVTYEIVRTTEVKKVEATLLNAWPQLQFKAVPNTNVQTLEYTIPSFSHNQ